MPIGPFLSKEELAEYPPDLMRLASLSQVVCYLPRWSAPSLWIANRTLLEQMGFSIAGIQKAGWSWQEISSRAPQTPSGVELLTGNLAANGFITQLALNSGSEALGDFTGYSKGLAPTLEWLIALRGAQKAAPSGEANMLGKFLAGKAVIVAGVRPVIYRFIQSKLAAKKMNWEAVALPAPYQRADREVQLVENGVISVYRTKGDEHVLAAVTLAKYLSSYPETGPWQELMLVPAQQGVAAEWRRALIKSGDWQDLSKLLKRPRLYNFKKPNNYQEQIFPVLREFVTGKISPEAALIRLQP